jgi:hypothetical protein
LSARELRYPDWADEIWNIGSHPFGNSPVIEGESFSNRTASFEWGIAQVVALIGVSGVFLKALWRRCAPKNS